MSHRPRRSALYMPGFNTRALEKAREIDADVLIFDLEDSVAPANKPIALDNICATLQAGGYGSREVIVRVNSLDSAWGRTEIATLAGLPLQGLCLPKVESAATLNAVEAQMKQAAYPADVGVWAMIETPLGVTQVDAIARGGGRLRGLIAGTNDLAAQLRIDADIDRRGLITALSMMILAARASGLDVLDGAFGGIGDSDMLEKHCHEGRGLGFDGKTLIHPSQVPVANRVFAPAPEAVAAARETVDAWEAAGADSGVIVVDGRMVEELHVDAARRVLAIAAAIGAR